MIVNYFKKVVVRHLLAEGDRKKNRRLFYDTNSVHKRLEFPIYQASKH